MLPRVRLGGGRVVAPCHVATLGVRTPLQISLSRDGVAFSSGQHCASPRPLCPPTGPSEPDLPAKGRLSQGLVRVPVCLLALKPWRLRCSGRWPAGPSSWCCPGGAAGGPGVPHTVPEASPCRPRPPRARPS